MTLAIIFLGVLALGLLLVVAIERMRGSKASYPFGMYYAGMGFLVIALISVSVMGYGLLLGFGYGTLFVCIFAFQQGFVTSFIERRAKNRT